MKENCGKRNLCQGLKLVLQVVFWVDLPVRTVGILQAAGIVGTTGKKI